MLRAGGVVQGPLTQLAGGAMPPEVTGRGAAVRFELEAGPAVVRSDGAWATTPMTLRATDASGTLLWTHPLPAQGYDPRPDPRQRAQ